MKDYYDSEVKIILKNVIEQLIADKEKKYIFAEMGFFKM